MKYWIMIALASLTSCRPASLEDLRFEGEAETAKLAEELSKLESRDDLQKAMPRLKKRFNRIARLLAEAREFPNLPAAEPTLASEKLFIELSRLYEIPGGRELIESAESEAVHFLSKE